MSYILLDTPNVNQPQGTYPRRGAFGKLSGTIIVHTSEGNWQNGVDSLTRLVKTRADWGCYHGGCDWQDIARYYPWEWETWQDTETNNWAVGIAAACKTTDWKTMPAEVVEGYYRNLAKMGADFVVYMRIQYGIEVPRRRISGQEARNRVPGFAAHGDSGVSRSDPGADFDWNRFFNYIEQELKGEVDELAGVNAERLNQAVDRILGRDVQRWMNPKTGEIVENGSPGFWALRSADAGDIALTQNLINSNTNRILDAIKDIPGVDASVIAGLREELSAELKAATENLTVTLSAE